MRTILKSGSGKKRKLHVLGLPIMVLAVALALGSVSAHAPSEMLLKYDIDSQTLTVTVVHNVSDPTTHYVYRIEIRRNDIIETKEYNEQPTSSRFTYTFHVPASPGDVLRVTAECNLGGSITETVELGESTTAEKRRPQLWPFHAALMSVGFLLMIVAVANIYSRTPDLRWLKAHKIAGALSSVIIVCGLIVAIYMVSQTGGAHFKVYHAYLGGLALLFSVVTPFLGYAALRKPPIRPTRTAHVWMSRTTIVLIVITLLSGLLQAGVL
jgi:desulfoferrodoxin (superoxide reductase-like protein)